MIWFKFHCPNFASPDPWHPLKLFDSIRGSIHFWVWKDSIFDVFFGQTIHLTNGIQNVRISPRGHLPLLLPVGLFRVFGLWLIVYKRGSASWYLTIAGYKCNRMYVYIKVWLPTYRANRILENILADTAVKMSIDGIWVEKNSLSSICFDSWENVHHYYLVVWNKVVYLSKSYEEV